MHPAKIHRLASGREEYGRQLETAALRKRNRLTAELDREQRLAGQPNRAARRTALQKHVEPPKPRTRTATKPNTRKNGNAPRKA